LPANARQVVSGNPLLVREGKAIDTRKPPAPHTAVGVDKTGSKLILLVVDGRREDYSVGMDPVDLANEMVKLGSWNAISLDGGGSSTMVLRDGGGELKVMNRPSDGYQLPIPLSI